MIRRIKERIKRDPDLKKALIERRNWLLFVAILGLLSSGLLAVASLIPVDEDEWVRRMTLDALGIEYTRDNVEQVFQQNINMETIDGMIVYRSQDGSIAFRVSGRGFVDRISLIVALEPDLETLRGLAVLEQRETPGLGSRIVEKDFLERFRGTSIKPALVILRTGETATADHEVDGISGATFTVKALEREINEGSKKIIQALEAK